MPVTFPRSHKSGSLRTAGFGLGHAPVPLGVPTDPGPGRPEGPASPAGGPTSGEVSSLAGWGFCRQRGCPAWGLAHLRVGEVPGAIVILVAPPGEPGPEVHLDQLPVRAEADVAEDAGEGRRGQETALVWPGPQAPTGPLRPPPAPGWWVQRSLSCPRWAAPRRTLCRAGQAAGLWASASSLPITIACYLRLVDGAAVGHPRWPPTGEDLGAVGSGARPALSGQAVPGRTVSQDDSWSSSLCSVLAGFSPAASLPLLACPYWGLGWPVL